MIDFTPADRRGERILLTPGPLNTSRAVREAMLHDIGTWDHDCRELVADIRTRLLRLCGSRPDLTCTLMQGSGSFGVEAIIGSAIPDDGRLLVLSNGAYGRRIAQVAAALRIDHVVHADPETHPHDPARLDELLEADADITHVACVHCETTTGMLNPIRELGQVVQRHGRRYIVDTISTFGAYRMGPDEAIDIDVGPIDHFIGSANKCTEGVPGFSFIFSRREALERCEGQARSLALDLYDQWQGFERTGRFRYTAPTHVMLAFQQALRELEAEGGIEGRMERYQANHRQLVEGMGALGFNTLIAPEHQSHIITTFLYPNEEFSFQVFYDALRARGVIIYPGKLTDADTFRMGNIGALGSEEIRYVLKAVEEVATELAVVS